MTDKTKIDDNAAQKALNENRQEAEKILKDPDRTEEILQQLERKLQQIPKVGDKLSMVPVLISLVRQYVRKEYTQIPFGSVIAIAAALIYVLTPVDLIPDAIPVIGYADDVIVIGFCLKMVQSDVDDYREWRKKNGIE